MFSSKMKNSIFRSPIWNTKIQPVDSHHTLNLIQHNCSLVKAHITTQNRVKRALVDHHVIRFFLVFEAQRVHNYPLHFSPLLVPQTHLIDDHWWNVDICDLWFKARFALLNVLLRSKIKWENEFGKILFFFEGGQFEKW